MENTKFSDIIELVLALLDSYEIYDLNDDDDLITTFFKPYIRIAAGELENRHTDIDLSNRDDTKCEFGCKFSDGEQLIIALFMCVGYLSRKTHDILQMQLHLQDGDFKTYAEKNNLDGKMNALYSLEEKADYELKSRGFKNFNWGGD